MIIGPPILLKLMLFALAVLSFVVGFGLLNKMRTVWDAIAAVGVLVMASVFLVGSFICEPLDQIKKRLPELEDDQEEEVIPQRRQKR